MILNERPSLGKEYWQSTRSDYRWCSPGWRRTELPEESVKPIDHGLANVSCLVEILLELAPTIGFTWSARWLRNVTWPDWPASLPRRFPRPVPVMSMGIHLHHDHARSRRPPTGRNIIEAVVDSRGAFGGADSLAHSVGLANRHQLKRQLGREGLPSLETLCGWLRMLIWLMEWEGTGIALSRSALREDRDPAIRFRCVKRTTGCTWGQVQGLGSLWVLLQLMERCQRPSGALATVTAGCA